jgi:hypothetical protein
MRKTCALALFLVLTSCASRKEVVRGYDDKTIKEKIAQLRGKTRHAAKKLLGNPAIEGRCKTMCAKHDLYRMIYLTKDWSRFYLGLSYNTDQEVSCHVLDFIPDKKKKQFIFDSVRTAEKCNQKDGEILFLETYRAQ